MLEFSVPMPYIKELIDKLLLINNEVKKSKITSLYFGLPYNCELFTGFEQYRNIHFNKDWNYWENLISYSIDKGFDFIYLLNRPNSNCTSEENLKKQLDKLYKLISKLKILGVNKLRIADHRLLSYIHKEYPDFILYSSTSFEYKSFGEYHNFIKFYPYIRQIVPSYDVNKNFKLLEALNKSFPNTEIELIVNQGCIKDCPFRSFHSVVIYNEFELNNDFSYSYFPQKCSIELLNNPIVNIAKTNVIFPWDIQEYRKIGIKKFKLVGRDSIYQNFMVNNYLKYLKGIDNSKNIENVPIKYFIERLSQINSFLDYIRVKDIKKYLPKIKHFKKHGHLCSSECETNCNYCYKYADKIQKKIVKKQEQEKLTTIPICVT